MILAVLSDHGQYRTLSDHFPGLTGIKVLCDNPAFYAFLSDKGIKFEPLGEENIKDSWRDLNTWACEKALLWKRLIENRSFFGGIELDKALYVHFSFYLASFLKNYLYADIIYEKYDPSEIVVFDDIHCPEFPFFNGNYFLNLFLKDLGRRYGLRTISMRSGTGEGPGEAVSVKERTRAFIQDVYAKVMPARKKKKAFIAYGEIRHLAPVMMELKNRGQEIIFYDFDFRPEQFKFCLKWDLRYFVPQNFLRDDPGDEKGKFDYTKDFMEITGLLRSGQWFKYRGVDLSGFLCDELSARTAQYFKEASLWARIYSRIMDIYDIEGLIASEDFGPRGGFMAAFFKSRGIGTFCVSHGYCPVKFALRDPDRIFFLSETFVHSEYERSLYSSKGWDKSHVHVTGVPRNDRLVEYKNGKSKRDRTRRRKMKIMFCANPLLEFNPAHPTYIGDSQFVWGYHMRIYLKDIIEAIEGYDIELIVRPHSWHIDDRKLWVDFIKHNKRRNKVSLVSAELDFFKLLAQCDAMIVGYWSTAVMEGIIFGIPTIVLDYTGLEDKHPFAKEGMCSVSRDPRQLRDIVKELYSSFVANKDSGYAPGDIQNKVFYTGLNDGGNTQRTVDHILTGA